MRWVVYALAALVALKIYAQDYFYRDATAQALIAAYGEKALTACRSNTTTQKKTLAPYVWGKSGEIKVQIGRNDLGVGIWELEHALWDAAFKQPYLILSPADKHTGITCTYDIVSDAASIHKSS